MWITINDLLHPTILIISDDVHTIEIVIEIQGNVFEECGEAFSLQDSSSDTKECVHTS